MIERIFIDSKDQNIAKYILFADDTYVYVDKNKTKKATAKIVSDVFVKGCFIDVDGIKYIPVSITHTEAVGSDVEYETITYLKADSVTPTTAVLATVRSTDVASDNVFLLEELEAIVKDDCEIE